MSYASCCSTRDQPLGDISLPIDMSLSRLKTSSTPRCFDEPPHGLSRHNGQNEVQKHEAGQNDGGYTLETKSGRLSPSVGPQQCASSLLGDCFCQRTPRVLPQRRHCKHRAHGKPFLDLVGHPDFPGITWHAYCVSAEVWNPPCLL